MREVESRIISGQPAGRLRLHDPQLGNFLFGTQPRAFRPHRIGHRQQQAADHQPTQCAPQRDGQVFLHR